MRSVVPKGTRYEEFYSADWERAYGFWHQIIDRNDKQIEVIKASITAIGQSRIRLLDLGCGDGDYMLEVMRTLPEITFEIVANDSSQEALGKYKVAASTAVVETILGRLENIPDQVDGAFDFVLCSHALYGVNVRGLFERFMSLLSQKGRLLIFLEGEDSDVLRLRHMFWPRVHARVFDETTGEDVVAQLNRAGLAHHVSEIRYITNLNKLNRIHPNGLRELYIPFFFRTRDIDDDVVEDVVRYLARQNPDGLVNNCTLAIDVMTKQIE